MSRIFLCLILLIQLAFAEDFTTQRFDVAYQINQDRSVDVTEFISVTFTKQKHGIMRNIPYRTTDGKVVRSVGIAFQECLANGSSTPFQTKEDGGEVVARIGDPNSTVSGPVVYTLKYRLTSALTNIGQNVELYWNVIPHGWPTAIEAASIKVKYPTPTSDDVKARALFGFKDTRDDILLGLNKPLTGRVDLLGAKFVGREDLFVQSQKSLRLGQGITLALSLPSGTVAAADDRIVENLPPPPPNYPWAGIIPLIPVVLFWPWFSRARDPKQGPLVTRFDPPENLGPSEAGLLIDLQFQPRDVVAGMIALAQKGHAKILSNEHSLSLELLGSPDQPPVNAKPPTDLEQSILDALWVFGPTVTRSDLKEDFYIHFKKLEKKAFEVGTETGNYDAQRNMGAVGVGCLAIFLVLGTTVLLWNALGWPIVIGTVLGIIILMRLIAGRTPYTPKGQRVKHELLGLREFISRANKKEFEFMVDRAPDQTLFENLLPYAIAFNMVKKWAAAFDGIQLSQPDWYVGSYGSDVFWYSAFSDDMGTMTDSWSSAVSQGISANTGSGFSSGSSGFSGGGSSGGGGGGGGGGSW